MAQDELEIRLIARDEATRVLEQARGSIQRLAQTKGGLISVNRNLSNILQQTALRFVGVYSATQLVTKVIDFASDAFEKHERTERRLRQEIAANSESFEEYARKIEQAGASSDFFQGAAARIGAAIESIKQRLGEALEAWANFASILPIAIANMIPPLHNWAQGQFRAIELARQHADALTYLEAREKALAPAIAANTALRREALRFEEQIVVARTRAGEQAFRAESQYQVQTQRAIENFNYQVSQLQRRARAQEEQAQRAYYRDLEQMEFRYQQDSQRRETSHWEARRNLLLRGGFWVNAEVRAYLQERDRLEKAGDQAGLARLDENFMERLRILDPLLAEELQHLIEAQDEEKQVAAEKYEFDKRTRREALEEQLRTLREATAMQLEALQVALNNQLASLKEALAEQLKAAGAAYAAQLKAYQDWQDEQRQRQLQANALSRAAQQRYYDDEGAAFHLYLNGRQGAWEAHSATMSKIKTTLTTEEVTIRRIEENVGRIRRGQLGLDTMVRGPALFAVEAGHRERVTIRPENETGQPGGGSIVININGAYIGTREALQKLAEDILRAQKQNRLHSEVA